MSEIFHQGQRAVQKIAGEEHFAQQRIPMLKPNIHAGAVRFIEDQILAFPASADRAGDIWLSLLVGKRGFINIPSTKELSFDLSMIKSDKNDIFFENIKSNPTVGILFHAAAQRSRYRVWGQADVNDEKINVSINLGYPSCPKHIQKSVIELTEETLGLTIEHEEGYKLREEEKEWISGVHTFFIGTQTKKGDMEASHRGGDPGFVEILPDGRLRVPDYLGNSMFSTLGNIYENPKAALLFVDFNLGTTLQLTGTAELQFKQYSDEDQYKSGETGRFWTFETKRWIKTKNHHQLSSDFIDFSPFNILTKK